MNEPQQIAGLVSVIIPVFNRASMLKECVDSVLAQDYRPLEIIVVDDGSTDDTPTMLADLAGHHSEIKIISQANGGPGVARESGRLAAQGEFIQYHDSDDLLLPGKLSSQVKALAEHPTAVAAYGKTERIAIGEEPRRIALKQTAERHNAIFPEMLRSRWWSTSTPLHRRSNVDDGGAWLPLIAEEDWENDCRLGASGGSLVYVDKFVSLTRTHDDHLSIGGTVDTRKLQDRCVAREAIFQHAKAYMKTQQVGGPILVEDWRFFSKSVFLLARQCAAAGLGSEAQRMIDLSVSACSQRGYQAKIFALAGRVFGWRRAARLSSWMGK
ncbi:MAG: glycosyltransferase family 2 protein [Gammaproteobacteria bacterium]|nr:glycosyltransferase family 2 protein [Gammaproteobacteria bacterium]